MKKIAHPDEKLKTVVWRPIKIEVGISIRILYTQAVNSDISKYF